MGEQRLYSDKPWHSKVDGLSRAFEELDNISSTGATGMEQQIITLYETKENNLRIRISNIQNTLYRKQNKTYSEE